MSKTHKVFFLIMVSLRIFSQDSSVNKRSNNITLDGNLEYVENNLIEAEVFYRKAISVDSLNNTASYNLANSFYKSQLNNEAAYQYKNSIKRSNTKQELQDRKSVV